VRHEIVAAIVGFAQWAGIPLCVLLAQAAARRMIGTQLVVELLLAVAVIAVSVILPLEVLGLIPLGTNATAYAIGSVLGGLLEVPITRFVRSRTAL